PKSKTDNSRPDSLLYTTAFLENELLEVLQVDYVKGQVEPPILTIPLRGTEAAPFKADVPY
ncbi:MAG TPA: hypothetical protein VFH55_03750, partial [Nitrospiria bacterium]|nr:hypothetical protein [Nitrospiria bacterium]